MSEAQTPGEPRTWKAVYTIVERPGLEKKLWIRIGTAFINRDQSINVRLDATPTNGQLQIRDAEPFCGHPGSRSNSEAVLRGLAWVSKQKSLTTGPVAPVGPPRVTHESVAAGGDG